jgi:hypothetical protein
MQNNSMKRYLLTVICALGFIYQTVGQNYGNEWINPGQKYFKIKIAQDGVYRIDFGTLVTAFAAGGTDLTTVDPRKIQIFNKGQEIPIYIRGESDGIFNSNDILEFFAEKNKGDLDNDLFVNSTDQLHQFESLISDTAIYFITFLPNSSGQSGKRLTHIQSHNYSGLTPENYFMFKSVKWFNNIYYGGIPYTVIGVDLNFPEYTIGEGYTGSRFGFGQGSPSPNRIEFLNTPHPFNSGPDSEVEYKALGITRNNNVAIDHHLRVSISPNDLSYSGLLDTMFSSHAVVAKKHIVNTSNSVGVDRAYLKFETVAITGVGSQGHSISWLSIRYPRLFNMNAESNLRFEIPASGFSAKYFQWTNYGNGSQTSPLIYDLKNNRRITPEWQGGGQFRYVAPATSQTSDYYITDSNSIVNIFQISHVVFPDFNEAINNSQFLIITHQKLLGSHATEYLNYRKTEYAASMYTVQQLYDGFMYGVQHPLAIRKFCRFLIDKSNSVKPEYLLLLGRGLQTNLLRNANAHALNLVPSIGTPSSDHLFTTDLGGVAKNIPYLATGRIAVDEPWQIGTYLNKLKEQEQSPPEFWKKRMLHLGGGYDGSQSVIIKSVLEAIAPIPENVPYGGKVTGFYKSATGLSEPFLKEKSIEMINTGSNVITFLGHGSATVLDVDIGDTTDYYNRGKLPVMYFNGCSAGNPNIGFNSGGGLFYGEKMIRGQNKGAIVFIGQSAVSELTTLSVQMKAFYQNMFEFHYGKPVGKILQETIKNNLNYNIPLSRIHNLIILYQGDPAYKVYAPELPDYDITNSDLFINPLNVTSLSDSFQLGIIIRNIGKFQDNDSLEIHLKRTWPNNLRSDEYTFKAKPVAFQDTVFFTIRTKDIATTGMNKFEVHLNPNQTIQESSYLNNKASFEKFIPGNGISLLFPQRYAIHSKDTVELIAQSLDLLLANNQFILEIDTSHLFNSPWRKVTQPAINAGNIVRWKVPLIGLDSVVYYWRGRLTLPTNEGGFWEDRSFIHIRNSEPGWSQSHHPQFYPTSQTHQIVLDTQTRRFEFSPIERRIWIDTDRNAHAGYGIKYGGGFTSQDMNAGVCKNGVVLSIYDKNTLELFLHPNHVPDCWQGALWPPYQQNKEQAYYAFNTASQIERNRLIAFINDLEPGTHLALFSRYSAGFSEWGQDIYDAFASLGCQQVLGLKNNNAAYVMVGTKGNPIGSAYENIAIYDPSQANSGYAAIEGTIIGKADRGHLISERIGPASEWGTLYFDWRATEFPTVDEIKYTILGIDSFNSEIPLFTNLSNTTLDISGIDAKQYQYLYLKADFLDSQNRSAPQLKHWLLTYTALPEGTVNVDKPFTFYKDTLQEGDSVRLRLAFENISQIAMDSIHYIYEITNLENRQVFKKKEGVLKSLNPNEFVELITAEKTTGMSGNYAMSIGFNPGMQQPEFSLSNNFILLPFHVINDNLNPLLDVTFDGRHIMNGEIVSPSPRILITSKDENKYLLQTDTMNFEIMLKRPGSNTFEIIDNLSTQITFKPAVNEDNVASIEYNPENLPDGIYTLKIQAQDMSGNDAGENYYQVDFEVINESSITHFYPYPNPFTTSMRFVFTVTGREVPDDIRVKIMTVSGRVVREIRKDELGIIRIGNNISEFTWDGTDEFGDRLSNGVYLYHVTVRNNGEDIKHRESAGDNSFKKNVGKIYLLR